MSFTARYFSNNHALKSYQTASEETNGTCPESPRPRTATSSQSCSSSSFVNSFRSTKAPSTTYQTTCYTMTEFRIVIAKAFSLQPGYCERLSGVTSDYLSNYSLLYCLAAFASPVAVNQSVIYRQTKLLLDQARSLFTPWGSKF